MSRAHVSGFDSNPAQFERMGNPWMTPREAQELGNSPVSKGQMRRNRKLRPCDLPYREIKRIARELTPEEAQRKAHRDMLWHIRRLDKEIRLEEDRVAHRAEPPREAPVKLVRHVRDTELSEWDARRIAADSERLAREQRRARIEAKVKLGDVKAAAEIELGALAL